MIPAIILTKFELFLKEPLQWIFFERREKYSHLENFVLAIISANYKWRMLSTFSNWANSLNIIKVYINFIRSEFIKRQRVACL